MEGGGEGALSSSTDQHYQTVFRFSSSSVGVLFSFKDGGLGSPVFLPLFVSLVYVILSTFLYILASRLP